ncbi:uncharacterized protein LOC135343891 isoform X1 [Halichondria panicea]|uniref:uncharacterized protein LOC135343891 isoform X1 n=1 Tax=Halichondria panicea TaxID=6063 RepID=UPI00312BC99A
MHSIQVRGLSSLLFSRYCAEQFECTECTVPDDFLLYAARAMSQLSVSNTLAKGFGCMRADRSDSLFPTNRMPMGLLEFMANFFVSSESRKVPSCPGDYRQWLQSPMWSVAHLPWMRMYCGIQVTSDNSFR